MIYGKDAFADLHFMDRLMSAKAAGQWDDRQGFLDGTTVSPPEAEATPAPPSVTEPETPEVVDTRRSDAVALEIPRPTPPSGAFVTSRRIRFPFLRSLPIWISKP